MTILVQICFKKFNFTTTTKAAFKTGKKNLAALYKKLSSDEAPGLLLLIGLFFGKRLMIQGREKSTVERVRCASFIEGVARIVSEL